MKPVATAAAVLVLASGLALQQATTWSFDDLPAGKPPAGFVFAAPPTGKSAPWIVVRDGPSAVLTPGVQGAGAQLAIAEHTSLANLAASVRLRFMGGSGSAGLVWRYSDPDNYYLTTLDLGAQEIRIYRVVRGNRTRLRDEDDLELNPGSWHALKVEHSGTRVRVWIDGVPAVNARDRSRQEPGAIGLWTAGDIAVQFDDLHAEPVIERDTRRD